MKSKRRSNSWLFQGFCFLKSAENDLKMRYRNVKLFLREPLGVQTSPFKAGVDNHVSVAGAVNVNARSVCIPAQSVEKKSKVL